MSDNPLNKYFRRPALWVRLPTGGRWYHNGEVKLNDSGEVQIYGLSAVDDIMLNTPDALLNGHALETVIRNCVPEIRDVREVLTPDLDAIYLGIKAATNNGKFEIERKCPKCEHDNTFDVQCAHLLDRMSYVEDGDTSIEIDSKLVVHIKPYDFNMRSLLIHRQFEEQRILAEVEKETSELDEFKKAEMMAQSIERIARLTFELVSRTITSIEIIDAARSSVTNRDHINEWLVNVDKSTADAVIDAVNRLNLIGPPKSLQIQCQSCHHAWEEGLNFDPVLFFGRS